MVSDPMNSSAVKENCFMHFCDTSFFVVVIVDIFCVVFDIKVNEFTTHKNKTLIYSSKYVLYDF